MKYLFLQQVYQITCTKCKFVLNFYASDLLDASPFKLIKSRIILFYIEDSVKNYYKGGKSIAISAGSK